VLHVQRKYIADGDEWLFYLASKGLQGVAGVVLDNTVPGGGREREKGGRKGRREGRRERRRR
jgi:hypothetical protein